MEWILLLLAVLFLLWKIKDANDEDDWAVEDEDDRHEDDWDSDSSAWDSWDSSSWDDDDD